MNTPETTELTTPASRAEVARMSGGLMAAEEQRAIQEVQAALVIAKRFPRDERAAIDRISNDCAREGLASAALYSFARGGTEITGPSIRLAEAIAQRWGNIEFGFRELYRGEDATGGYSEIQTFAWDLESNSRRSLQFRVRHWRDTKKGGYALKDERDIYELIANQSQRRVRACILAIIPGDVVESAQSQCEATLSAKADNSPETQAKIVKAFAEYKVTKDQIEALIQRRMDAIQPAQVIRLRKILASLRDGMSTADEWFAPADKKAAPVDPFEAKSQTETQSTDLI